MTNLTDRLQLIADCISPGERVADIGTDHGFLPLYLYSRGISPHVIMADISAPSLAKAEANFAAVYPDETFDLRLGDGLKVLDEGEIDTAVMAGMGGELIIRMLEAEPKKTASIGKYIFQPRSGGEQLRRWLAANDFAITADKLVREGKYICNVIVAMPERGENVAAAGRAPVNLAENADLSGQDICFDVPEWILQNESEITGEYLSVKYEKTKEILTGLKKAAARDSSRIAETEYALDYLSRLISKNKTGDQGR